MLADHVLDLQEKSTLQKEREATQKELRKTQQLLRQLERQLAKAHMTRKDSANAMKQLQVSSILLGVEPGSVY